MKYLITELILGTGNSTRTSSVKTTDLFAGRINFKLHLYVAWKPDAQATFINAFSINWAQFTLFLPIV